MILDEADFDQISWHDNYIYSIALDVSAEDWKSDLILDIDYIAEWLCGIDRRAQFLVAAATLRFHDVTDLKIKVDWGDTGFQVSITEMSIHYIERERIQNQLICLDRPYYEWTIHLNYPVPGGDITFGASGFTQTLRQSPVLCDEQKLTSSKRPKMD